ncbi:TPA: omptin family outer membrane protease, partial [Vibrio vulnificus]|nr:omptin family outer membrane protease [Vibrio vulnificus]
MKKTIAAVCLGVSFPVVAAAEDFSAGAAAGILNGNAKELVYNTADRSKLSELTW